MVMMKDDDDGRCTWNACPQTMFLDCGVGAAPKNMPGKHVLGI